MRFWMKFVNQPILWGLAVAMILIIGIIVGKTPGLLTIKGGAQSIFGGWGEIQTSYADIEGGQDSNGWIVDVLTNYPAFSGATMQMWNTEGKVIARMSAQYNIIVGLLITVILFASVIIFTRKSASAIFILGPLLVGLIATLIISTKTVGDMGMDPNIKMGTDIGDLLFNWLVWYGGVGLVMFFVTKALIRKGLVRGIDEPGPLDFSRLQQVAVTAAGKTIETAGIMGDKLHRVIGDNNPSTALSASGRTAGTAEKLSVSTFQVKHCSLCGGYIKNGKCSLCHTTSDIIADPVYGLCVRCDAPKTVRGKFCYHCGLLFENEPSDSPASSVKFCSQCGKVQNPGDKFCASCGASNQ